MKKIIWQQLAAVLLCFCMVLLFFTSVEAKETSNSLTLTYKGKTAVIHSYSKTQDLEKNQVPKHFITFKSLKKAFGKPKLNKDLSTDSYKLYQYEDKGMSLSFAVPEASTRIAGVIIDITSKKAALNGIKVGMSFQDAKNKLEKKYGKKQVSGSGTKGRILLQYGGILPVEYLCKNGKVSKMYVWSFWCS